MENGVKVPRVAFSVRIMLIGCLALLCCVQWLCLQRSWFLVDLRRCLIARFGVGSGIGLVCGRFVSSSNSDDVANFLVLLSRVWCWVRGLTWLRQALLMLLSPMTNRGVLV